MDRLKVYLQGQLQVTKELDPAATCLVGRGEGCDIVLNPERGISRQHFQLQFIGGKWVIKVLSKFGELYKDGHKLTQLELRAGASFSVPPYEFIFESDEQDSGIRANTQLSVQSQSQSMSDEDRTHIGYIPSMAYLRLVDGKGEFVQNYRLDGAAWIGGRDVGCSIFIDNPRISRRQFEMYKQDDIFYIRDLGSVNVTQLNGRGLPSDQWTQLQSMDVISVADWVLNFELRDSQFEQRLGEVDQGLRAPMVFNTLPSPEYTQFQSFQSQVPATYNEQLAMPHPSGELSKQAPKTKPKTKMKLNPVRIAIILILVGAGVFKLMEGGKSENADAQKKATPFEKLPVDKQQYVKQAYLAAQAHLAQGNYELARQEVLKIHQVIPSFEDSKQIEAAAARGVEMLYEMDKLQQQEAEKKAQEEKINSTLAKCKAQLKSDSDMAWLDSCVAPVLEFVPDHPGVLMLRAEIERNAQERIMKEANAAHYRASVAKFKGIFQRAVTLEKKGDVLSAIKAYGVATKSKLPDPGNLRKVASVRIDTLTKAVQRQQEESEKRADAAHAAEQFREAVVHMRKAVKYNPENEVMKGKLKQYELSLKKAMLVPYQEGILEESVGNLELAKKKWKTILELSIQGEEYYEKALAKLKKYGPI